MPKTRIRESVFTSVLLKHLRAAMPTAVIFKNCDFYTAGIPDFSVSMDGITTWFEVKIAPNKPTALQAEFLKRLAPRAHLITWHTHHDIEIDGDGCPVSFSEAILHVQGLCLSSWVENNQGGT